MRGYFAIGVEGVSKPMNVGALVRVAHAFGAAFCFTVSAATEGVEFGSSDTSDAAGSVPLYHYPDLAGFQLPKGCALVGIELNDRAVALPSFRHPRRAAYVLGSEKGGLSPAMVERCEHVVRIPARFSINLALAGGIVLYDRMISLGRFAARPLMPGGGTEAPPPHVHGPQLPPRAARRRN